MLALCLAGWSAQEGDVEVAAVVVDNDSPDDLASALARFAGLDVAVVSRRDLPDPLALASARNIGIGAAVTSHVVTCDADCVPSPTYLQAAIDALAGDPDGVLLTGERVFVARGSLVPDEIECRTVDLSALPPTASDSNYGRVRDLRFPAALGLPAVPHPWTYFHGGNTVYPTVTARSVGGYDERFDGNWGHDDIEFAHRMITEGACVPRWIDDLVVYHVDDDVTGDGTGSPGLHQRWDRTHNPNWTMLCERIPGYAEFKARQYRELDLEFV